ncbi:exosome nuclease subunit [Dimargaris verticillata]|uniref:Exosome nuclease subunit n=1 Tax=Dimargaris verticillata TaxID=2761393 RepID=A0A9W8ED55_9FUNG|nr:exosome nuclease subunit [Dimargaris verticillata]
MSDDASRVPSPHANMGDFAQCVHEVVRRLQQACDRVSLRDVSFEKTIDGEFADRLTQTTQHILKWTNRALNVAGAESVSSYEDVDSVAANFDPVVDVVDNLMEKTDAVLDDIAAGRRSGAYGHQHENMLKQSAPIVTQVTAASGTRQLDYKLIHAQNIVRPQLKFREDIDNSATAPFAWKLQDKPNALVPLEESAARGEPIMAQRSLNWNNTVAPLSATLPSLPNPYAYEITHISYPPSLFAPQDPPQPYLPFDSTEAQWIDTVEQLTNITQILQQAPAIAVDLEHHNLRSFQGFVCLMQISTRDQDFLIDTLALRPHIRMLNPVFTDPNVIKVFHGADMDVKWLQRDFGIYVVDLFDTFHASRVLGYPHASLAYLLKRHCDVVPDKRYQLADWRIRPLPTEMAAYAQSDTHYLLYIYDCMKNELLAKASGGKVRKPHTLTDAERASPEVKDGVPESLVKIVLKRSEGTALQVYRKDGYDAETGEGENGWSRMLHRYPQQYLDQQMAVFKALHKWRDQIAREEDEGLRYVLPNHMLLLIAKQMPTEVAALLGICNPVPPLVRMYAADLVALIARTRAAVLAATNSEGTSVLASIMPAKSNTDFNATTLGNQPGLLITATGLTTQEFLDQHPGQVVQVTATSLGKLDPNLATQGTSNGPAAPNATSAAMSNQLAAMIAQGSSLLQSLALGRPRNIASPVTPSRANLPVDVSNSGAITEDLQSQLVVDEIRANLSWDLTQSLTVDQGVDSSGEVLYDPNEASDDDEEQVHYISGGQRKSKSGNDIAEVVVLADRMKRSSAHAPASAQEYGSGAAQTSQFDVVEVDADQELTAKRSITLDDMPRMLRETFEPAEPKLKKPHTRKRKQTDATGSNKNDIDADKDENSAQSTSATLAVDPSTIMPFDYTQVQSTADIGASQPRSKRGRHGTSIRSRFPGAGGKGDVNAAEAANALDAASGANFNEIRTNPKLAKSVRHPNLKPKSGNRSSTFDQR